MEATYTEIGGKIDDVSWSLTTEVASSGDRWHFAKIYIMKKQVPEKEWPFLFPEGKLRTTGSGTTWYEFPKPDIGGGPRIDTFWVETLQGAPKDMAKAVIGWDYQHLWHEFHPPSHDDIMRDIRNAIKFYREFFHLLAYCYHCGKYGNPEGWLTTEWGVARTMHPECYAKSKASYLEWKAQQEADDEDR